jgi:hypothetical protein
VGLETSAFIYLLEKVENGSHVLIASEALIYEIVKVLMNKERYGLPLILV